jgi:pentose-5-phosphate-3-epimerase
LFYFMDETDRQPDDPTQQEILERCNAIRKENRKNGLKLRPATNEQSVAKLLRDVYSLPITYLRFYDW